jgi:hypothetical protein
MLSKVLYDDDSNVYKLYTVPYSDVTIHLDTYMDSLSFEFHPSERQYQYELMVGAAHYGFAWSIQVNNIEVGFVYALPVGKKRLNIVALYTTSPDQYKAKFIMVDAVHTKFPLLRYTPRDPNCACNNFLLEPSSLKAYKMDLTFFIKMKPWEHKILTYLGIQG